MQTKVMGMLSIFCRMAGNTSVYRMFQAVGNSAIFFLWNASQAPNNIEAKEAKAAILEFWTLSIYFMILLRVFRGTVIL